jgi:hypothetical protein
LHPAEQAVSIITKYDSVFHFEYGKVAAVVYYGHDEDDGYAIIIRNQKDEFICYSNMKCITLKKGDIVESGTWLGLTGISEDGAASQLDFIYIKKRKQLSFRKTVEYIR